jgi:flagellar biosynthesis protein FliQ
MDQGTLFDITRQALWVATMMSLPILGVALVVGLVIGLMQALTSIQEMTLTFVPKLAAILGVFWVTMDFMTQELVNFYQGHVLALISGG